MTLAKPLFSVSPNFSTCLMERMLLNPTPFLGTFLEQCGQRVLMSLGCKFL